MVAALAAFCSSGILAAQGDFDIWTIYPPAPATGGNFGDATCVVDVDRDGFSDVVVLESGKLADGQIGAGMGWVFFGPEFEESVTFKAREAAFTEHLGSGGCSAGDVNGDGWPDILVGSPDYTEDGLKDAGRAHVFLGPTFEVDIALHDPFPEAGASLGDHGVLLYDQDADGTFDAYVGSIRHDQRLPDGTVIENSGRVYCWPAASLSGAAPPGSPISVDNPVPFAGATFGAIIVPEQPVGPGYVLVSAPGASLGTGGLGLVHRLAVGSFELLESIVPPPPDSLVSLVWGFGQSMAVGQLGPDDEYGILVTAYDSTVTAPGCPPQGGSSAGAAFVLTEPLPGKSAFTIVSPAACDGEQEYFGLRSLALDLNGDGQDDLVITDRSKSDHDLVHVYWGPHYSSYATLGEGIAAFGVPGFGQYIAAGDIDADGFDELLVSAYLAGGSGIIYVHDWRTLRSDVASVSVAAGGDVQFALDLSTLHAGKTYLAALGISGSDPGTIAGKGSFVPLNVDAVTLAGLALLNTPLLEGFMGTLDADGQASFALHLPGGFPAALVGSTLTVAAVVVDPGGRPGAGSSAVQLELAP